MARELLSSTPEVLVHDWMKLTMGLAWLGTLAGCGEAEPGEPAQGVAQAVGQPVATLKGKRFAVFYQTSKDVTAQYAADLPEVDGLVYVFAHSGASVPTSAGHANTIHLRPDFLYAPAFDLFEHEGWESASEAQLSAWAHEFRDLALAAGADLFSFNELPSTAGSNANVRVQALTILRALAEPKDGKSLRGVLFMTHKPSMPDNWTEPASLFWQTVDETCDAVVTEHYHGPGFVCSTSQQALGDHFFGLRRWLEKSGEPSKKRIANEKFTVLHSSRYAPGTDGWQGASSDTVSLARFQRDLSRLAFVTRTTPGGFNRISFAPVYAGKTVPGVHDRIAQLIAWHYGHDGAKAELACIDGFGGNCNCN